MKLSRRTRVLGFATLSVVYVLVIWGWLFARRVYEMRVVEHGVAIDLVLLVPRRTVRLSAQEISEVRVVPSARGKLRQLQIVSAPGKRYRSPELPESEASRVLQWLKEELETNPRSFQGAEAE